MKAVEDDAGKAIGFGPDEATNVFVERECLADFEGAFESAHHEVEVEFLGAMGEAACDTIWEAGL